MCTTVRRWGNSASIRIPAPVLAAANLAIDPEVDVREDNGRIIIEPIEPENLSIASLTQLPHFDPKYITISNH